MHHKFAILDRKTLLIGSYNWTRSTARADQENNVLSDDVRLVADVRGCIDQLWTAFDEG